MYHNYSVLQLVALLGQVLKISTPCVLPTMWSANVQSFKLKRILIGVKENSHIRFSHGGGEVNDRPDGDAVPGPGDAAAWRVSVVCVPSSLLAQAFAGQIHKSRLEGAKAIGHLLFGRLAGNECVHKLRKYLMTYSREI